DKTLCHLLEHLIGALVPLGGRLTQETVGIFQPPVLERFLCLSDSQPREAQHDSVLTHARQGGDHFPATTIVSGGEFRARARSTSIIRTKNRIRIKNLKVADSQLLWATPCSLLFGRSGHLQVLLHDNLLRFGEPVMSAPGEASWPPGADASGSVWGVR